MDFTKQIADNPTHAKLLWLLEVGRRHHRHRLPRKCYEIYISPRILGVILVLALATLFAEIWLIPGKSQSDVMGLTVLVALSLMVLWGLSTRVLAKRVPAYWILPNLRLLTFKAQWTIIPAARPVRGRLVVHAMLSRARDVEEHVYHRYGFPLADLHVRKPVFRPDDRPEMQLLKQEHMPKLLWASELN